MSDLFFSVRWAPCRVCGSGGPLRVCEACIERRACRIFGHDMDDADWCTRCHRHVCSRCEAGR